MDAFMEHVSVHILDVEIKLNPAPQEAGQYFSFPCRIAYRRSPSVFPMSPPPPPLAGMTAHIPGTLLFILYFSYINTIFILGLVFACWVSS